MILLSSAQTAYIVASVIAIIIVIALLIILFIKNKYRPKHTRELTYLKLHHFCEANDYLLLNNYRINIDDSNIGIIDHIVISNKFIVIINDFPISAVLSGDFSDDNLSIYDKNGGGTVVNPLNYNVNLAKRLALFNNLSQELIRGIVVINSDSKINVTNNNAQFRIVRLSELKKTIKQFDKVNVKKLKEDDVVRFINYLDKQNQ